MIPIPRQYIQTAVPPIIFIGVAFLAGSKRLIQYFPGASRTGLLCSSSLASTAVIGSGLKFPEEWTDRHRRISVAIGLVITFVIAPSTAKELTGRADLNFKASFCFTFIQAGSFIGVEVLLSIPKVDDPSEPLYFGPKEWRLYFGDVGEIPPLPENIDAILDAPCPYWPHKNRQDEITKVKETHMLTLIPKTVGGRPLTLNFLQELIQSPRGGGNASPKFVYYDTVGQDIGDRPIENSYWVLMTEKVLPNSIGKSYLEQQALLVEGYSPPKALEAAASILMHYVKTGERLYFSSPYPYINCEEQEESRYRVGVGTFEERGLGVHDDCGGGRLGVWSAICGVRRL